MKAPRLRRSPAVAFQGERSAFSEQAVRQLLGPSTAVLPCVRFEDIFRNLKQGSVAGAMVPIENTLADRSTRITITCCISNCRSWPRPACASCTI